MTSLNILEIFKQIKKKQKINHKDKYKNNFSIKKSVINTNEGKKPLLKFQYIMLTKLINSNKTFMGDQSHALYYNHCFDENIKIGKFLYNMILLKKNENVYQINCTTGKIRQIIYKKKINLKKRKR